MTHINIVSCSEPNDIRVLQITWLSTLNQIDTNRHKVYQISHGILPISSLHILTVVEVTQDH